MIVQRVFVVLIGICCLEIHLSMAFHLTITPEFAHIPLKTDVSILCKADVPLTRCQFRVLDERIFDLSDGYFAPYDKAASYYGEGLENGECGVTFTGAELRWAVYAVGCRVRSETSDWVYAEMTLIRKAKPGLEVTISPSSRRMVVLPGEQIQLLVDARKPLIQCQFVLTDVDALTRNDFRFNFPNNDTVHNNPIGTGIEYYGTGLSNGQCGLQIQSATENHNNGAFIDVFPDEEHEESAFFRLIVAKLPHTPGLAHNITTQSDGSVELNAWCYVTSRPVSNVTWYLGDEPIPEKYLQYLHTDEWMWPSRVQTVKHKLTMKLGSSDDGKALWCQAEHVSLQEPKKSRTVIIKVPKGVNPGIIPQILPTNISPTSLTCTPLKSQSVIIICTFAGEEVDCGEPQQIGTVATLTCKPGYAQSGSVVTRRTVCQRGGKWNRPLFSCHPDCGRRHTNTGETLISGGKNVIIGEFPWHIGIFQTKGSSGTLQQICGGSLISPKVVISAAHCFWVSQNHTQNEATKYKVAAGKHIRSWDDPDPNVQKRDVLELVLHVLFRGALTSYASDIALVRVQSPFQISAKVNLICLDLDNVYERSQLKEGSLGVVAGWGFTEEGEPSERLKYVNLPFVPSETCLNLLPTTLQTLFTPDKFCAGYVNQSTSVCRGDSGGGLVFRDPGTDKYYLRGIVSIAFTPASNKASCYSQFYTAFTSFAQYIQWTEDKLSLVP